jgi:hypothetical protein
MSFFANLFGKNRIVPLEEADPDYRASVVALKQNDMSQAWQRFGAGSADARYLTLFDVRDFYVTRIAAGGDHVVDPMLAHGIESGGAFYFMLRALWSLRKGERAAGKEGINVEDPSRRNALHTFAKSALADLQTAASIDPADGTPHTLMYFAWMKLQHEENMRTSALRGVQLAPNAISSHNAVIDGLLNGWWGEVTEAIPYALGFGAQAPAGTDLAALPIHAMRKHLLNTRNRKSVPDAKHLARDMATLLPQVCNHSLDAANAMPTRRNLTARLCAAAISHFADDAANAKHHLSAAGKVFDSEVFWDLPEYNKVRALYGLPSVSA